VLVLALLLAFAVVLERVRAIAGGPLPPSVGVTAPDARGADLDGRPLSTRALAGQVLLVDFWATWCPPCVAAMPGLARLDAELGPRGFRVVGVNQDGLDVDVVRAFFREKGFSVSTIMDDGQIARAWAVFSFPTSFVVDRRGQIRAVHRGFVSADALRAELEPLLAEPAPAPAPSAAARAPGSSVVVSSGDPEGRSAEAR
jgi:thiol-disulfide isomerase/thioredoxin